MDRLGAAARRAADAVRRTATSLHAEYEAGRRGDETPTTPIYPSPKGQAEALLALMRTKSPAPAPDATPSASDDPATAAATSATPSPSAPAGDIGDTGTDGDAAAVAGAFRGVDWRQIRAATGERTGDATRAMKAMAAQVDWDRVQPVAAQVSSTLIAAVATGRLPVGGSLGPIVARALTDSGALSAQIGRTIVEEDRDLPPDFRDVIDVTGAPIAPLPPALDP